jgi:hypothetical protein
MDKLYLLAKFENLENALNEIKQLVLESNTSNDSDNESEIENEIVKKNEPPEIKLNTLKKYYLEIPYQSKELYKQKYKDYNLQFDHKKNLWYIFAQLSKIPTGLKKKIIR